MKIAGVDEVGIGCLAGPLISAAVIFGKNKSEYFFKDSKKTTQKNRAVQASYIKSNFYVGIGVASPSEIDELIEQINKSGYGLTMGLHTRIESRADYLSKNANVGNIYINRDMVGAVVGSQPFGGVGLSGSGFKAGGPNYLLQFLNEKVISKNSVAFGGNAELLNLQEDL